MDANKLNELMNRYPPLRLKGEDGNPSGDVRTGIARAAFVKMGENGKFRLCLMFPAGADLAPLAAIAREAGAGKWGDKVKAMNPRWPIKPQDANALKYQGFVAGAFYIEASSKFAPACMAADGKTKLPLDPDVIYSGCYVRCVVNAYPYGGPGVKDPQGNPIAAGISFGLQSVQKIADGEKLGGGRNAADDFDAIEGVPAHVAAGASAAATASVGAGGW